MIEGRVKEIPREEVEALKAELMALFNRELFERTYYSKQLQRFDGEIFNTVKWLMREEEKHVNLLRLVLNQADILVPDEIEGVPTPARETVEVIKTDIEFEVITTKLYDETIEKFTPAMEKADGTLKEILVQIRDEELNHIEILKKYLEESE